MYLANVSIVSTKDRAKLDLGWFYIRVLEMIGLASVKRAAPTTEFLPAKSTVDVETVTALIRNRFHVLKLYGAQVIGPVLKAEFKGAHARRRLRRFRKWLTREDLVLNSQQRKTLEDAIRQSNTLKIVVEFKQRLKALMQPSVKDTDRLARLQEWCANAEATGIKTLDDFAKQLRGYSMRTA